MQPFPTCGALVALLAPSVSPLAAAPQIATSAPAPSSARAASAARTPGAVGVIGGERAGGLVGWSTAGDQAGAELGHALALVGDVNGDGFDDALLGAYRHDGVVPNEGAVFVHLGTAEGLSSEGAWSASGGQTGAQFGHAVAAAGDVNGDGYDDVLVGAFLHTRTAVAEGAAYLFLGSPEGLSDEPAWAVYGAQAFACLGNAVASAGDVNGDGFDDVLIGAYGFDAGQVDEGAAFLFLGSAAGLPARPDWIAQGGQSMAWLGAALAPAGDVNGDGYDDVLIGASGWDGGQLDGGAAFVFLGSAGGLAGAPAWTGLGDQPTAMYGAAVASAGDVNGDGFADVAIGAPLRDAALPDAGAVFVHLGGPSGPSLVAGRTILGDDAGGHLGTALASAGDRDGDGFTELAVGAGQRDGESGADAGFVRVFAGSQTGLEASARWEIEGEQAGELLGVSLAGLGDVDADGYSDLLIGASGFDGAGPDSGAALLAPGAAGTLAATPVWSLAGDTLEVYLGAAVASAGDVNGDGLDDVLVGVPDHRETLAREGQALLFRGLGPAGLTTAPVWSVPGGEAQAVLGSALAGAGDVNGDGLDDVLVAAPGAAGGLGSVFLYYGASPAPAAQAAWRVDGGEVEEAGSFGASVASAGDVNGDGFADLLIGSWRADGAEPDAGAAFLYLGSPSGPPVLADWTVAGEATGDGLGWSVASAGDVDGDGYSDVIVGAPGFDGGLDGQGRALVYLGSAAGLGAEPAWTVEGGEPGAAAGTAVASAGDVNGDGYADVVVGVPGLDAGDLDAGAAWVFLGSPAGLAAEPSAVASGDQAGGALGSAVASAGDVNGDGRSDVVLGAFRRDGEELVDAGWIGLWLGTADGALQATAWSVEGSVPGEYLGLRGTLATAGDVNGDGYADVVAGSPYAGPAGSLLGSASVHLGNAGGGRLQRVAQRRLDDRAPIAHLGLATTRGTFRIRADLPPLAGGGVAYLEWQAAPVGTPFASVPVGRGPAQPLRRSGEVHRLEAEVVAPPIPGGLRLPHAWRARVVLDGNAFYPSSAWFTLGGRAASEAELRFPSGPRAGISPVRRP